MEIAYLVPEDVRSAATEVLEHVSVVSLATTSTNRSRFVSNATRLTV